MERKRQLLLYSILTILFIAIIGFSYAWFNTDFSETGSDIIVDTAEFKIIYTEGNEVNLNNVYPGDSATKTFTMENISEITTYYAIKWRIYENTFINDEFVYTLTKDGEKIEEKVVPFEETIIIEDIKINPGETHTYELTIKFIETEANQNYNLEAKFSGKIEIIESIQEKVVDIAAGSGFVLALTNKGNVYAWGKNDSGQLGNGLSGAANNSSVPTKVKDADGEGYLSDVKRIGVGTNHSVAIKNDGTVWAWGRNNTGQLGINNQSDKKYPVQVLGLYGEGHLTNIDEFEISGISTIVKSKDNIYYGWGANGSSYDLLGINNKTAGSVLTPRISTHFDKYKKNWVNGSIYGIDKSNNLFAWGVNTFGCLGDGTLADKTSAVRVKTSNTTNLINVKDVWQSGYSGYAIREDDTLWAWGYNLYGQLGIDNEVDQSYATQVKGINGESYLTNIESLCGGRYTSIHHAAVILKDKTIVSFGRNNYGQLGNGLSGEENNSLVPVRVLGENGEGYLGNIKKVYLGMYFTVALTETGEIYAWGENTDGQLGTNEIGLSTTPIKVNISFD